MLRIKKRGKEFKVPHYASTTAARDGNLPYIIAICLYSQQNYNKIFIYLFKTLNIQYLKFYHNSLRGCHFIKVENLRFCMGKGCARSGIVCKVAWTPSRGRFFNVYQPNLTVIATPSPINRSFKLFLSFYTVLPVASVYTQLINCLYHFQ